MTAHGLAILLSAFLLFQIQPAIAKAILPWFGGTPAVWTTCLVFFQSLLVAGYAYADVLATRLRPRAQVVVHTLVLGAALLLALPIAIDPSRKPSPVEDPTAQIFAVLGATIGLPYFVLSSTSPLLQAWASRGAPGRSPYRLYALSNMGSVVGLASYPFVVEPSLAIRAQLRWWSAAFLVFAAVSVAAGIRTVGVADDVLRRVEPREPARSTPIVTRFLWFALPACGSILLLAVTNRICREIAVVPFLWVMPLMIYLLSFILCFESDRWYRRRLFLPALLVASVPVAFGYAANNLSVKLTFSFHALLLFVACMACHGELARLRPEPARLTSFYLASALGGAGGGGFVAILAPRLFDTYFELQCGIVLALLLPLVPIYRESPARFAKRRGAWFLWIQASSAIIGLMGFDLRAYHAQSRLLRRNFYGTVRIMDVPDAHGGGRRILQNGATTHGLEMLDPDRRREPTSYYGRETGVGRLFAALPEGPRRLGIVGLGVGTLAAYARPADELWFYEINPLVLEVANREFHYLADTAGDVHVELGDARLVLEAEPAHDFDVLVADAFSSDAIPMHLLTLEAFRLYFRHLKPDGVLAVHISNRALDLRPVVAAAAQRLEKSLVFLKNRADSSHGVSAALWALLSSNRALVERLRIESRAVVVEPPPHRLLWTDDFTSLFPILK